MIEWNLLKKADRKLITYLLLQALDTICIMVSLFAIGMAADCLLYGNGAAYILLFGTITISGAVCLRGFLRKALADVTYPMVLYLCHSGADKAKLEYDISQLSGLVKGILVLLGVALLCPKAALLDALLMLAAYLMHRYVEEHMVEGKQKTAWHRSLPYNAVMCMMSFISVALVMMTVGKTLSMDSALTIFLYHAMLSQHRKIKIGSSIPSLVLYLLSGLAYLFAAGSFSVGLLTAVEMWNTSLPLAYVCMTCLPLLSGCLLYASQRSAEGYEFWWSMVPLVLMHCSVIGICAWASSMLGAASAFAMCAIIVLLPVLGVTLYKDIQDEMEEDDDYSLYVHVKEDAMPAFSVGMLLFIGLMAAFGAILYLRNAVMYRNMLLAVVVFSTWALGPYTLETSKMINAFWNEDRPDR